MNKANAKDYLPLVQALAEGKTIQYRNDSNEWLDCEDPAFHQHTSRYRVKPEPSLESLEMANYLEEMAKRIREMKCQPHKIKTMVIAAGGGEMRNFTLTYSLNEHK